ncbi:(p)ppGpp synthetase [Cupriavidus pauculus]|uniref:(P)ppGpp synthetase n=1 Tax=Cupriavidus pauculus TaxID=82633 RepID=A0A5P2H0V6_9BURK|nr:RelA/SpoT domain-containing protein [Cupriavidus pauculus]QET01364.1 (p)ppGpp synthetase [Cupriavidus pauculus]
MIELAAEDLELIDSLVGHYREKEQPRASRLAKNLFELFSEEVLTPYVHSVRRRAKDPDHLRDKLARKMRKAKAEGKPFAITPDNLFNEINDLAGVRLLHLHTSQFPRIDAIVRDLLRSEAYEIVEGPTARIWDDEYKEIFTQYGIETVNNSRLYTSVHYVVSTGGEQARTAEIQVRTLAEELWGEVDHTINYPTPSEIQSCKEQIKVLARLTSSCTRLVDSIFLTGAN